MARSWPATGSRTHPGARSGDEPRTCRHLARSCPMPLPREKDGQGAGTQAASPLQWFHHHDVGISPRIILDRCQPPEPALLVEGGRLEGVGRQYDLAAAPTERLFLGRCQEARAKALPTTAFGDPKRLDLAATAPTMPVQAGIKLAFCRAQQGSRMASSRASRMPVRSILSWSSRSSSRWRSAGAGSSKTEIWPLSGMARAFNAR